MAARDHTLWANCVKVDVDNNMKIKVIIVPEFIGVFGYCKKREKRHAQFFEDIVLWFGNRTIVKILPSRNGEYNFEITAYTLSVKEEIIHFIFIIHVYWSENKHFTNKQHVTL